MWSVTPAGPVWDSTTQAPNMGGPALVCLWCASCSFTVFYRGTCWNVFSRCWSYDNVVLFCWGWWCVAGAPAHGGRGPSPDRLRPISDDVRCVQIYGCSESHERGFGEKDWGQKFKGVAKVLLCCGSLKTPAKRHNQLCIEHCLQRALRPTTTQSKPRVLIVLFPRAAPSFPPTLAACPPIAKPPSRAPATQSTQR